MIETDMKPYLSVVIPSFNERSNLERGVIDSVVTYLQKQTYTWEVILSDDGSTDGTTDELSRIASKSKGVQLVRNVHAGKAPTVAAGMLEARGEWRLFTDFDQSTPIQELETLLPHTEKGYEIVIGSREAKGAVRDKEPLYRHIMGRAFNLFVQILAVPGIQDTQCGFKLFSATAAEVLFPQLVVYGGSQARKDAYTGAFDVELLYLARKCGFNIKEVPITWIHNTTDRVNPWKDSFRMLRDILRIRWADMSGQYQVSS
ncbi:MAG: dolichyl-phosphate beta-glucosyltransferase [Patescibacteria group bacterium]